MFGQSAGERDRDQLKCPQMSIQRNIESLKCHLIYIYIYVCVHVRVCACVCVLVCVCVRACLRARVHVYNPIMWDNV